jgi:hypothetical protein
MSSHGLLIDVAASDLHPYQFTAEERVTAEERADIEEAMAKADHGEFASDAEIAAMWKRFGL